jgi:hypothetical protein
MEKIYHFFDFDANAATKLSDDCSLQTPTQAPQSPMRPSTLTLHAKSNGSISGQTICCDCLVNVLLRLIWRRHSNVIHVNSVGGPKTYG